jgi:hypothetical protein
MLQPHCLSIFKKTTNEYKLFLEKLNKTPQEITSETIAVIEDNYNFSYSSKTVITQCSRRKLRFL